MMIKFDVLLFDGTPRDMSTTRLNGLRHSLKWPTYWQTFAERGKATWAIAAGMMARQDRRLSPVVAHELATGGEISEFWDNVLRISQSHHGSLFRVGSTPRVLVLLTDNNLMGVSYQHLIPSRREYVPNFGENIGFRFTHKANEKTNTDAEIIGPRKKGMI